MSGVNISILEGGKGENFGQVTKLRTDDGNSGHDLWVPKTDVKTGHLSVKKNGLYYTNQYEPSASEKKDGKFYDIYGWDTVTVSVKKKAKGKKKKEKINPDGSISEVDVPVKVEVDDDDNLIETELPTSIKITKKPKNLNYVDGQDITIEGIVVHGYLEDGTDWGEVPFDELGFDPHVASIEGADEYSDGEGVITVLATATGEEVLLNGVPYYRCPNAPNFCFSYGESAYITYYNSGIYAAFNFSGRVGLLATTSGGSAAGAWQYVSQSNIIKRFQGYPSAPLGVPTSLVDPQNVTTESLSPTFKPEVTVTWDSEDLDEPLSDTYEITVGQGPIPPNS